MGFSIKATTCSQIVPLLDQYAEGDLSPSHSRNVERHIAACVSCRQELQVVDRVLSLVKRMERPVPPPDLWYRVHREISQPAAAPWYGFFLNRLPITRQPVRWNGGWLATAAATATVAAGLVVGGMWPHSADLGSDREQLKLATPSPTQMESASYMVQAEQASLFDPLADRASLATMVETSNQSSRLRSHFTIDNAMSGSALEGGAR